MSAENESCLAMFLPAAAPVDSQISCEMTDLAMQMDTNDSVWIWLLRSVLLPSVVVPTGLFLLAWLLWDKYFDVCYYDRSLRVPLPPGSMGLPLLGETFSLMAQGATFYESRKKKHGHVFKTFLFGEPIVRVSGSDNVRKILTGESTLVGPKMIYSVRHLLGSDGTLVAAVGEQHRFLRKGLMKAFSHSALAQYCQIMQELTREAIQNWCQAPLVIGATECKKLMFRAFTRVLLGLDLRNNSNNNNNNNNKCEDAEKIVADEDEIVKAYEIHVNSVFSLPIKLPGSALYKGLQAKKTILAMIDRCVRAKQRQLEECERQGTDPPGRCALHFILQRVRFDPAADQQDEQDDRPLTAEELRSLILEQFFAGQSGTSATACMLMYYLARNPGVMDKLTQELDKYGLISDCPGNFPFELLSKLTYLDHVVKELLRIAPAVGGAFRKALKTFELNGYQIPKGWTIVYSIRETQAGVPLLGEHADEFLPERWEKQYVVEDPRQNAAKTRDQSPAASQGQGQSPAASEGQGRSPAASEGQVQSPAASQGQGQISNASQDHSPAASQGQGQSPAANPDGGAAQGRSSIPEPRPDAVNHLDPPPPPLHSAPPPGPNADTTASPLASGGGGSSSSSEDRDVLDPYEYLPFGRGSRSCPGQVLARLLLKVLVLELVRGCRWRLLNPDVALTRLPNVLPADKLPMQVTPLFRQQQQQKQQPTAESSS